MFGNFTERQRVVLYTFGYLVTFLLTIAAFLAMILIVEYLAVDPVNIFMLASMLFLGYVMVQMAIMYARSRVRDEVEREKRIEKLMTNDN
jgi:RsiW-degrading membrane proteinase PrsW (M82 family)